MSARDQAKLFDTLAVEGSLYDYNAEHLGLLREHIQPESPLLDFGCGDGAIAAFMDSNSFGFDVSPACAKLATRKGVHAAVADGMGVLPFADRSFQTVTCFDVLHHLHGAWSDIIRECARVLRPSGRLIILEPDARNPFVRWTQAPGSFIRVAPYDNEPAIHPDDLTTLLKAEGFDVEVEPFHLDGDQRVRSVFPLWQRIAKAPFVIAAAQVYGHRPNKFLIRATRPLS